MPSLSHSENSPNPSRIQVRMAWRLVLCLFGHLTLLFFLAIYLVSSLNSVRLYTPVAHAEEIVLESLNTIPALLGAMDAERRAFQKSGDSRDLALYSQMRDTVERNLDALNTPLVLPSEQEKQRRALVRMWISDIGDFAMTQPKGKTASPDALNTSSRALLNQLRNLFSERVLDRIDFLDSLVPAYPAPGALASRNHEYPFQDAARNWHAPSDAHAFSVGEMKRARNCAGQLVRRLRQILDALDLLYP